MDPATRRPTRLIALIGGDGVAFRDSMVALVVAALASLVAGLTLAATTKKLEALPGLLLLVPAAIASKGNVFGALGSRLGTAIHAGTIRRGSRRLESVVGQNTAAALSLSLIMSVILAVLAKGVALAFNVSPTMSLADFVAVSAVAGTVASLVVLVITLLAAGGSVRYGWDLDNVVSPLVTATGDVVSLPALVLAAELAGVDVVTPAIAWTAASIAALVFVWTMRTHLPEVVRVVRQSVPVLVIAGTVDLVAGITVEKRLDDFLAFPVLLILLPGFLGTAGALGGVLSSRLATKMHLGLLRPAALPGARARGDIMMVFSLSVPVFAVLGLAAQVGGVVSDHPSPGSLDVITVAVLGGLLATIFVVLVAYYGTAVAVQFGLDPDTYGIPMVTSSLDFVGAFAFIFAAVAVGVA